MVSNRARGAGRLAGALLLAALLCLAGTARAADSSLVFLTLKEGVQDASGSGDSLFTHLERDHGHLRGGRQVTTQAVELDFYAVTSRNAGMAVGTELQQYSRTFNFRTTDPTKTNEDLKLSGRALLFTLKGFLRWGPVLPFFGVGSGNYYAEYHQSTEHLSLLDSAPNVYTVRIGTRVLLGRWGLLLESGQTSAPMRVHTQSGNSTLNLGGTYNTAGLSYLW